MNKDFLLKPAKVNLSLLLLILVLIGFLNFLWLIYFFNNKGYLPSPFIMDKSDTFMDFFNPLYWTNKNGLYTDWLSVYPPLNFLILKILYWLVLGDEEFANPFLLRESTDEFQIFILIAFAAVPLFVITRGYWKKFSVKESLLIYFATISCMPIFFALERGNLVIISLLFLTLAINSEGKKKLIYIAFLINLKPYFVLLCFIYLAKKKWLEFIDLIFVSIFLFLLSGLIVNQEFYYLIKNIFDFSQRNILSPMEVIAFPVSISALSYLINLSSFSFYINEIIDMKVISELIEITKWITLMFVVFVLLIFSKNVKERHLLTILVVMITNIGVSVGGYTLIFYLTLIPILCEMRLARLYIVIIILMILPIDLISIYSSNIGNQFVFISGEIKPIEFSIGFGALLRPTLNFILLVALTWDLYFQGLIDYSIRSSSQSKKFVLKQSDFHC